MIFDWSAFGSVLNLVQLASWEKLKYEPNVDQLGSVKVHVLETNACVAAS